MNDQLIAMIRKAMATKGWKTYQLSAAIGLLPNGRAFNTTQLDRLLSGDRQIRRDDAPLVARIIDRLDLDAPDARERFGFDGADLWHAAGLWPPDLSADGYRTFVLVGGTKRNRYARALRLVHAA